MKTKRKESCETIHQRPMAADLSKATAESRAVVRQLGLPLLTQVCRGPQGAGQREGGREARGKKWCLSWLLRFEMVGKDQTSWKDQTSCIITHIPPYCLESAETEHCALWVDTRLFNLCFLVKVIQLNFRSAFLLKLILL